MSYERRESPGQTHEASFDVDRGASIAAEEPGSPSGPESTGVGTASRGDRGTMLALATLAGLIVLGLLLIARGPQLPSAPHASLEEPSATLLLRSEVPGPSASAATPAPPATVTAEAGPKFVPTWRISALEHDPATEILRGSLEKRTLASALAQTSLSRNEVRRVLHAASAVRRVENASGKDTFVVARSRSGGSVVAFELIASPTDVWQARSEDPASAGAEPRLALKKLELFVEKKRTQAAVVITADLARAISAAGLKEGAIEEIDEALEGHGEAAVIRPGVRLRIVGTEDWVEGMFAGYRVDAIEYVPKGAGNPLRVYYYEREASTPGSRRRMPHKGFYDARGQQPFRGMFRSPVPLARITSRFNPKRMHPVLHVVMPHNGIDFGASTGTPVYASGEGTVQTAGDGGPCGNMVQILHANGLTTAYCHLSRFAAGLHAGQHVDARQLVGYVGRTGRATGPHLHFAVKRGGTFLDPSALKMDGVRTLPQADRDAFAKRRAELDVALEAVHLPPADGSIPADDKDDKDDNHEPAGEE